MAAPMLSGSVGIIGGADGPTAIFVSGGISLSTLLLIAGGVCALVALVTILIRRRK